MTLFAPISSICGISPPYIRRRVINRNVHSFDASVGARATSFHGYYRKNVNFYSSSAKGTHVVPAYSGEDNLLVEVVLKLTTIITLAANDKWNDNEGCCS